MTNNFRLLERGAIPNSVQLFSETPLHTSASMGYEECVRLLVDHGACLEVLVGPMKMTALHLGAQVRYLLRVMPNLYLSQINSYTITGDNCNLSHIQLTSSSLFETYKISFDYLFRPIIEDHEK